MDNLPLSTMRKPTTTFITPGAAGRAVASLAAAMIFAGAHAQAYPNKPVRVVTSASGGSSDIMARLIAQGVGRSLGQNMIVENRGGGFAAIEVVARAIPDGYTLLYYGSILWLLPLMHDKAPYDTLRDFEPVTWAVTTPVLLVVHPSVEAKSVKELIALAKAKPGALNYGSGGNGSSLHLAAELFNSMAGVKIVRIPYKGGGPALMDLVAGHLHLTFSTTATTGPFLKAGKLRALAATGAQRTALYPNVPTIAEAGLPGYESEQTSGLFTPAKTSPAIIGQLHRHSAAFLTQPQVREQLMTNGVEAVGSTPQQFAAKIKAEVARMGKVIKDAGIRDE